MKKRIYILIMAVALGNAGAANEFSGELFWGKRVQLSVPVSGVVKTVPVRVGDQVRRGQVLVTLDPSRFSADVRDAKAHVDKRREAMVEAEKELNRAKELYDRTVLSNTELDQKLTAFAVAKAEYESAQAQLRKKQVDWNYAQLKAPFAGIIARRNVEVGQTIVSRHQAEPLIVLVENERMIARVPVGAEQLPLFAVGKSAMVKISRKDIFPGKVIAVGVEPVRRDKQVWYDVDVEFQPKEQLLRAGQSVTVVMP